ncbi:hypothetical protein, partial [Burkholderia orbicola]|uniref:hypothetical protein n=1 Tax=Burkholderia orbicola TaxID=2978683 RepID=UPI003AF4776A
AGLRVTFGQRVRGRRGLKACGVAGSGNDTKIERARRCGNGSHGDEPLDGRAARPGCCVISKVLNVSPRAKSIDF